MSNKKKKTRNNQDIIIINKSIHNILTFLFSFFTKLIGNIYNNILIYIIIFLLFIIAFGSFVKIPLDILLNYMYLPDFLQNIITLFQNNDLTNTNTGQITANIDTASLEKALLEITSVQTKTLEIIEKQSENIVALQKSIENISIQKNNTIGLNKVIEQMELNNKLTTDLISINKTGMKLTRATHDATMLKFSNFETNVTTMFKNIQQDFINVLNVYHKEYLTCLQNNNLILKNIQEQTINSYVLNQNILASTQYSVEMQQAGFEALLQSSTNNNEYITKLQDHYYIMENKLQQISKENISFADNLKEEIYNSQKEYEKSTAIGFLKDKMPNIDITRYKKD